MTSSVRNFLRAYWIALQRVHKDARARRYVAVVSLLALDLTILAAIFVSDRWNGAFNAVVIGSGMLTAILIRRWHKRENDLLEFSLTGQNRLRPQDAKVVSREVCEYLSERAAIVASLLARGGSELYIQQANPTLSGVQIITRQIQNSFLRDFGLWEKMEQTERELSAMADGAWATVQPQQLIEWCEQLRLLRWLFGIDAALFPLEHHPKVDFSLAWGFVRPQIRADRLKPAIEAWQIRPERDTAQQYAVRVLAEFSARGHLRDDAELGWAEEFRANAIGASRDYLAGSKTIADLNDQDLYLIGTLASARERYGSYLIEQLNAPEPTPFSEWCRAQ